MMREAQKFHADALRARRAVSAQRASSSRGRRAKALALAAFRDYAIVGQEWVLCGQARLKGRKSLATRYANAAKQFSRKGNRLLVSAGRLLG
jgi:hypothetical protein